uniref:hypothetical protein n=1 Tax=Gemmiger formicilis TaxID=745368 RepID=UPI003FF014D7
MRKRDDFEDDGRTIADMSGIGPAPTLRPHRRKADAPTPEPANDRPWEQAPDWTPKEKFWAVMGVLKATLAIAGVYLVGLGVLLAVLFLLWK